LIGELVLTIALVVFLNMMLYLDVLDAREHRRQQRLDRIADQDGDWMREAIKNAARKVAK
jgi:hypothetical protein